MESSLQEEARRLDEEMDSVIREAESFSKRFMYYGLGVFLFAALNMGFRWYECNRNREAYLSEQALYSSETELNADLKVEKQKLGLGAVDIIVQETSDVACGQCRPIAEKQYLILFNPQCKSKRVLRHELYHIYGMENFTLDDILWLPTLGEFEEWKATNYSLEE
jgi:hypothetical protein